MTELPVFITRIERSEDANHFQYGKPLIAQPSSMSLTLEGYFSVSHQLGCLMLIGYAGTGTAFLLSCTEDEMIKIQNFLDTIRG